MNSPRTYRFPSPARGADYSAFVNRWLVRSALSLILHLHKNDRPLPSHEELSDYLYQLALDRGGNRVTSAYDANGIRNNGSVEIDLLSSNAATFALYAQSPAEYLARAAAGGRKSKRSVDADLFARFMNLPSGMSKAEQAEALGCSVRTVANYRQRVANTPDADTLILSGMDAQIAAQSKPEPTPDVLADIDIEAMFTTLTAYAWGVRA